MPRPSSGAPEHKECQWPKCQDGGVECIRACETESNISAEPTAWLITRANNTKHVVLSPLTDNTYMDKGDKACPLYQTDPLARRSFEE